MINRPQSLFNSWRLLFRFNYKTLFLFLENELSNEFISAAAEERFEFLKWLKNTSRLFFV